MKNKKWNGVVVPSVTPLTQEFELDHGAVERMFNNFRQHGVHPFILGTTGEAPSLPFYLKEEFLTVAGRFKKADDILYVGISSNVFAESIALADQAAEIGADVLVATLPSYYALTGDEMLSYFEGLAEAVSLPLMMYNIPATVHMSIPLDVIDKLSQHPNIIGIKDSERSEERLQQSLALWKDREDFGHYLGWAAKSADALLGGSEGIVPSTGNFAPQVYRQLLEAVENGDHKKAYACQQRSDALGDVYQKGRLLGTSLWSLKVLMHQEGLCEPIVMPPLQPLSNEEEEKLLSDYKSIQQTEFLNV